MSAAPARLLIALGVVVTACAPQDAPPVETRIAAASAPDVTGPGNLDILFVVGNAPGMAPTQSKLADQLPVFIQMISRLPMGVPNLHVAVISSDLGAPGDSASSLGCSQEGDQGLFQVAPRGSCTDTTLVQGATFLSNVNGDFNYASPEISEVLQCILPVGDKGCGFQRPLAAIAARWAATWAGVPAAERGLPAR